MNMKFGMALPTYIRASHTGTMQRYAWRKLELLKSIQQKHLMQKASLFLFFFFLSILDVLLCPEYLTSSNTN